jgi:hypothetical protein
MKKGEVMVESERTAAEKNAFLKTTGPRIFSLARPVRLVQRAKPMRAMYVRVGKAQICKMADGDIPSAAEAREIPIAWERTRWKRVLASSIHDAIGNRLHSIVYPAGTAKDMEFLIRKGYEIDVLRGGDSGVLWQLWWDRAKK